MERGANGRPFGGRSLPTILGVVKPVEPTVPITAQILLRWYGQSTALSRTAPLSKKMPRRVGGTCLASHIVCFLLCGNQDRDSPFG